MMDPVIQQVKQFVYEESHKPSNYYSGIFENHLVPMRDLAVTLAKQLGADIEVVELAAWLHDIGGIKMGRKNHHLTGARIAEEILQTLHYPPDKVEHVKQCILSHRGSQDIIPESIEAQIILEADSMSNFDNIQGIFKAAYVDEGLSQPEARISAREKLERKWNRLQFDASKKLIKPKYEAAMLLLR